MDLHRGDHTLLNGGQDVAGGDLELVASAGGEVQIIIQDPLYPLDPGTYQVDLLDLDASVLARNRFFIQ